MSQVLDTPGNLALVAATLDNALGEALMALAQRTETVRAWAATSGCPVPHAIESGASMVQELLNHGSGPGRLTTFRDQAETLYHFVESLAALERFRSEQSDRFRAVRDFFNSMVNANAELDAVRQFIRDYRTLEQERAMTRAERWSELYQTYRAAQTAVERQITAWRDQTTEHLAELNRELQAAVAAAGVPEEQVNDEAATLSLLYEDVRRRLARDAHTFGEARSLLSEMLRSEQEKDNQLRELRARYQTALSASRRLAWYDLLPVPVQLNSAADLDAFLADLRSRIAPHLGDDQDVMIE
jgi:hypothetical protein